MQFKQSVARGSLSSEHIVQLFDSTESLAHAASSFLAEGLLAGDPVLIVGSSTHWRAIVSRLEVLGVPTDAFCASGHITVRDAADQLAQFMCTGSPDEGLFHGSVGNLVRDLSRPGRRLRIFGDMVNLLAAQGEYQAARQVEEFWNGLGEQVPFALFCAYSAEHFGDPRSADALREICRAHSHVRSESRDLLGSFLLDAYACRHLQLPDHSQS